ncbi:MAG: LytR/AlgR family response regulator transcription factor [Flavobacteriales bacterium]
MSISAIIIDDEQHARSNLKILLEDYCPNVTVVAEAQSADEAREQISLHNPNLLFLDINMPGEDGFDLLNSLEDKNFSVIFITAHNQFALKALKAGAIDYLEKPIDIEQLIEAVGKIKVSDNEISDFNTIKKLIQYYQHETTTGTIAIPTLTGYEIIKTSDIVRLEADESYTKIFLSDGKKCVSSMTIARYEKVLNENVFFRVHKSHIINTKYHLKEFNRQDGNIAIMDNGSTIPVSRRKVTEFINAIKTF